MVIGLSKASKARKSPGFQGRQDTLDTSSMPFSKFYKFLWQDFDNKHGLYSFELPGLIKKMLADLYMFVYMLAKSRWLLQKLSQ